jgi:hypothetical protein
VTRPPIAANTSSCEQGRPPHALRHGGLHVAVGRREASRREGEGVERAERLPMARVLLEARAQPLDRLLVPARRALHGAADGPHREDGGQREQQQAGGRDRVGPRQDAQDGDQRRALDDDRAETVCHVGLNLTEVAHHARRQAAAGGAAAG